MNRIFQIVVVAVFVFSCKSELSKIDINQVELHRKYQDSILDLSKNADSNLMSLKMLISDYKNLKIENKEKNENYLYLIGRLYSQLFSERFPFKGFVFDTLKKQMIDSNLYINYYDSSMYYNEEVLRINPNHIRSMLNFSSTYFNEAYNYGIMNSQKINIPYSNIRDSQKFSNRFNYILNNSTKFYDIDTSKNKEVSKSIIVRPYEIFSGYIDLDKLNYENVNDLNILLKWNEFYTYSNKFKGLVFSKEHNEKTIKLIDSYKKAKNILDEIQRKKIEEEEIAKNTFTINHDGSRDWDKEATLKSVGEEVWSVCYNNPNAVKIILNISDKCNDSYGKSTIYTSTIVIKVSEINVYRKYQTSSAFNANCFEWGYKLMREYKPCGRSQLDGF